MLHIWFILMDIVENPSLFTFCMYIVEYQSVDRVKGCFDPSLPFTALHFLLLTTLTVSHASENRCFVIKTLRHYKFTMVKGGEGQWRVKRTLHQVISLIINYIHRLSEGWRVFAYFVANPLIITSPVSLSCMNAVLSPCRSWCPPTRFHLCSQRSSAGTFSDVSGLWQYLDCIKQNPWMAINYDNSLSYISIYCLLTLI